jgi:hypothetical protein
VPRPRSIARAISRELEAVVLKCLERNPDKRYQSAQSLGEDLRAAAAGEAVSAHVPGALHSLVRAIRRRPILSVASACVGIGAVIIGVAVAAANLAVWKIAREPYGVRVSSTRDAIEVVARNGRPLRRLMRVRAWSEYMAARVELPGGGWMAVAAPGSNGDPATTGRLLAYRPHDWEHPAWSMGQEPGPVAMPPFPADATHDRREEYDPSMSSLTTGRFIVADVFDDPGDEIVGVFSLGVWGASCLRVIRPVDGVVLYEAWHDGSLWPVVWLSEPRRLIARAMNHRFPSGEIWARDVIFAIEPDRGGIHNDQWICSPEAGDKSGCVWYSLVVPPGMSRDGDDLAVTIAALSDSDDVVRQFAIKVGSDTTGWAEALFDAQGERVMHHGAPRAWTIVAHRRATTPDPDQMGFRLVREANYRPNR